MEAKRELKQARMGTHDVLKVEGEDFERPIGVRVTDEEYDYGVVWDPSAPLPKPRRLKCKWCGKALNTTGRGRPKTYCSHSCRQRAYESRRRTENVTDEQVRMLLDRLFELRCQAEDIETACREGIEPEEMTEMCQELVQITRKIEAHPSIVKMLERKE